MSTAIYNIIFPPKSKDKNTFNYVYQITELSTGMKYIGSRGTTNKTPYNDLIQYQSSSTDKAFKQSQKDNPSNFNYEIISYHDTRKDATIQESHLHVKYNVKDNLRYYNKVNQTANGFCTAGYTTVYNGISNIFVSMYSVERQIYPHINKDKIVVYSCLLKHHVQIYASEYNNKDYITPFHNKIPVKYNGYNILIDKDDIRYKNTLFHVNCGMVRVVIDGEVKVITTDEYKNGTYQFINQNKVCVKNTDGKWVQLDRDSNEYRAGNFTKMLDGKVFVRNKGGVLLVNNDDPRFLNGDLLHTSCDKVIVRDKNGKAHSLERGDNRIGTEFEHIFNGKTNVYDVNGNIHHVCNDDPRILSGEFISIVKNMSVVIDKYGNKFRISKDDPLYLSGEVVQCTKIKVFDKDGHSYMVYKNNPLLRTGKLIPQNKKVLKEFEQQKQYRLNHNISPFALYDLSSQ